MLLNSALSLYLIFRFTSFLNIASRTMRWVSNTDRHLRAAPCYEDSGFEHLRSTYSLHIPYPALLITLSIHPRWSFQAIPPLLLFTPYRLPSFPSSFDFSLFLFPLSFLYLFSYFKFRNNFLFFAPLHLSLVYTMLHIVAFWLFYSPSVLVSRWSNPVPAKKSSQIFVFFSIAVLWFFSYLFVPFPGFLYIPANLIVAVSSMTKKHGLY